MCAASHRSCCGQASIIAEEVLKQNPEAIRIIYNKFKSAINFKPSIATILSAEVTNTQISLQLIATCCQA
jgi:F0F1-type ATP synthase gamma subunit